VRGKEKRRLYRTAVCSVLSPSIDRRYTTDDGLLEDRDKNLQACVWGHSLYYYYYYYYYCCLVRGRDLRAG